TLGRNRAAEEVARPPRGAGDPPVAQQLFHQRGRHLVERTAMERVAMDDLDVVVHPSSGREVAESLLKGFRNACSTLHDLFAVGSDARLVPEIAEVEDFVDRAGVKGIRDMRRRTVQEGDAELGEDDSVK